MAARDLRATARQMTKMAQMMELVELARNPQALQDHLLKKEMQKVRRRVNTAIRKSVVGDVLKKSKR